MNRRTFARTLAAVAVAAATPRLTRAQSPAPVPATAPFPLSVMLWTVFGDLPFAERLEKVAEAGYSQVELVGEYANWSAADFASANAARKRLGIRFDATAGLKNGVANPATRQAFLDELKAALVPMETLECPAMIVLSGNTVEGLTRAEQHEASIETLRQAARLIAGRTIAGQAIRLLLETIDPEENSKYFLTQMAENFEVVRAVNHPQIRCLYDFFHEQIAAGNLIEKLERNIDLVGLVHIADVPGRHQPGTGEINFEQIYRTLRRLHYQGTMAMEFLPEGDPVSALRKTKAEALRILGS